MKKNYVEKEETFDTSSYVNAFTIKPDVSKFTKDLNNNHKKKKGGIVRSKQETEKGTSSVFRGENSMVTKKK